jgi:hypothetical protein
MKARIVSIAAMAALMALGGSLRAADDTDANQRLQRLMGRFHKADLNGDGQLTREEAQKGMPRIYQHFSEIDAGNKGYVTLAEIASYMEAHPAAARGRNPPATPPTPTTPPSQ